METDPSRQLHYLVEVLGRELVLCDFCHADFGSFDPEYLGQESGSGEVQITQLGKFRTSTPTHLAAFCPKCEHQLPFLHFLKEVRRGKTT